MLSKSHVDSLGAEIVLEVTYIYLSEMKHAGCQCGIGMTLGESIAEVLLSTCSSAGYHGDGKVAGQQTESLVGKSCLDAVVIHRREEYLSRTSVCGLTCPVEQGLAKGYAP